MDNNKKTSGWSIFIVVVIILFIISKIGSCDDSSSSSSKSSGGSSYTGTYDATLEYGSGGVIVATSKEYLDQYLKDCNNNNTSDIQSLKSSGKIATVAKGTKCNTVNVGIATSTVKLLEGSNAGKTVYVISESVKLHKN